MLRKYAHLARAMYWAARYGFPGREMYLVGVTGTDGKTTTCTLIYEILKKAGLRVGVVTTVGAKYVIKNGGEIRVETGLHTTNPGPEQLQPILQEMLKQGVTHVILEVTSHGLDQYRVWGCEFKIGVWTNLTHEHLDYHKTFVEYRRVKAKLFDNVRFAVLNGDDPEVEFYKKYVARVNPRAKVILYGESRLKEISESLLGKYNRYNVAAAEEVAKILKINKKIVGEVVMTFKGVEGRRERVDVGQKFKVFVDFAHTPNALENVLKEMREELPKKRKLLVLFGCPGERDKSKRHLMGNAAVRWADWVIITADDPRWDDLGEIFSMATADFNEDQLKKVERIDERREAIKKILKLAKEGDIVVLAGKGHEKSLAVKGEELPWSDAKEATYWLTHIK